MWRCTQYSVTVVVLSIVVVTIVALSIVVVLSTQRSALSRKHCIVIVKRIGLVDIGLIAGHDTRTTSSYMLLYLVCISSHRRLKRHPGQLGVYP